MKYQCDDGNAEIEIEADSAQDAAQEYVDDGDWGDDAKTFWVDVHVSPLDAAGEPDEDRHECITVTVNPDEPDCTHEAGHAWAQPYALLGGLKENPGVVGSGGGVRGRDVCLLCGLAKNWDSWAQRPDTGEQGLDSVEYVQGAYAIEVHASADGRHAIDLDDAYYIVELDGDEATLRDADPGDEVGDYVLTEAGWEECPVTVEPTGFLHHHYPAQTSPQGCYVELDCDAGALSADWNAEIGNAVPMFVWHHRILRWDIPALRAEAADELLANIKPLAVRIMAGYSCEWDGNNMAGSFDDDATEAIGEVEMLCSETHDDDLGRLHVWAADEWLSGLGDSEAQADDLKITARTTDEALEAIEERLRTEALHDNIDALEGLGKHLTWLRQEARDRAEVELEFGQLAAEYGVAVPEQDADVDVRVYVGDDNEWHVGTRGQLDLRDEEWAPTSDEQAEQLRRAAQ
jgi:hypothetical protein